MAEVLPDALVLDPPALSVAAARLAWLRRLTAGNFGRVPPLAAATAPPASVQVDPAWPPVWCRLDRDRAAVAVNGHAALVPWSPDLPGFVAALAPGASWPYEGLRKRFPAVPVSRIVPWLAQARALV